MPFSLRRTSRAARIAKPVSGDRRGVAMGTRTSPAIAGEQAEYRCADKCSSRRPREPSPKASREAGRKHPGQRGGL
eukprot:2253397-Lingulodinium_polyedra.AAC.1